MIISTPTTEQKFCNQCARELPLHRFDRMKRGSEQRRSRCRECTNEYLREYKRKKRAREFTAFTQRIEQQKDRHSTVENICTAIVRRFGGLGNFAKEWKSHIDAAPRGSAYVLRQCKCIVQLIEVSSKMRKPRNLDELSDEELAAEIFDAAANVVDNHPKLVLEAAERLGAKVIWLGDDFVGTRRVGG